MEEKKTAILNTRTFEETKNGLTEIGDSMKPKVKASTLAHDVLTKYVTRYQKRKNNEKN